MGNETSPIVSIASVTKRFPGVVALSDVSFDVGEGELHSICGENGAGKSTLMKILCGVITSYDGEILLKGSAIKMRDTREAEDAGISIIHQELNLVEELSAAANIFLGREMTTSLGLLDDHAMELAAAKLLTELECHVSPSALAGSLRVGDQQLVEIAKALSLEAEILIMDEPTSALTEAEVERLYRVIERLRERNVTILYISHKMDEVFRLSDRITVLRDGQHVKTLERTETSPREITHLMVGREIDEGNLRATKDNKSLDQQLLDDLEGEIDTRHGRSAVSHRDLPCHRLGRNAGHPLRGPNRRTPTALERYDPQGPC